MLFSLALALATAPLQQGKQAPAVEPPPAPGVCRAVADRLDKVVTNALALLEDDAKATSKGRAPRYDNDARARIARDLEADRTRNAAIRKRHAKAATPADVKAAADMHLGELTRVAGKCVA
ncbi:hypothetical protein TPR58_10345 [Sphingomonas sp. HF-S3]|uniref:Uncharacterized protein n=1 Tax=Sphingomonas rustica TaxID=3103142 RepID=A0ABV0B990_9SPHN